MPKPIRPELDQVLCEVPRDSAAFGLFVIVAGCLLVVVPMLEAVIERFGVVAMYSERYRLAQVASTTALLTFACSLWIFTCGLATRAIRRLLGLPLVKRSQWWLLLQILAGMYLFPKLFIWSIDEVLVRNWRFGDLRDAPFEALALGLAFCALFALDTPRWLRNGIAALRFRTAWLAVPFHPLDRLPQTGLVHTRGVVTAVGPTGFSLESNGGSLQVSADPAHTIVLAPGGALESIAPDSTVDVVGELTGAGGGGAFRGGPAHLRAGREPIRVVVGLDRLLGRLRLAAAIDLIAAASIGVAAVALCGTWTYLLHRI